MDSNIIYIRRFGSDSDLDRKQYYPYSIQICTIVFGFYLNLNLNLIKFYFLDLIEFRYDAYLLDWIDFIINF